MNAKEISDATLPTVTPDDEDLMILYDVSEGTTGKATIAGIAPKVAGNIDIATLPAVTPAANDVLMIRDTSEGTTGKATIADIISVGDTSLITESSALPNIGTAANATQHEVNAAVDSNALFSKLDPQQGGLTFNGDLNDLTTPGIYSLAATVHIPSGRSPLYGTALVFKGKYDYLHQEVSSATATRKWVRFKNEKGWSNWMEVTEPKTVSLYLTTSQLGISAGSTVSVDRFISSLWSYLSAIYPEAPHFNVNGQMVWNDSQSFNITDGNRTIPSSGAKFDFFVGYFPWSCNGGIFLTENSGAYRVRCRYFETLSDIQEDIFQITLT